MRVTSPVTQDVATAVVIITANICHCHTTAVVIITANISHYHTITAYICHCHTTNYDGRQWFVSIQSLYHRPRPHNCHPCDILLTLTFTRLHTTEPKLPCTEITCYTLCPKKESHLMFDNNYGKCGLFFKILSPTDSWENSLCIHTKTSTSPAICCYTTLWNSKIQKCYWFWQHPQQTVDMFLRTLWGLELTFS